MAQAVGMMGFPNTGKSHSRSFIKDASDCFVISPSQKFSHLFKDGKALPDFNFKVGNDEWKALVKANKMNNRSDLIATLASLPNPPDGFKTSGNSVVVPELQYIISWLQFIDKHMPHIKNIWLADFTHWMSNVIATTHFQNRKAGGEK